MIDREYCRTVEQGSELWKSIRLGRVTAGKVSDVMAKGKDGKEASIRQKYKVQLVAERLTGFAQESFSNAAMEWGIQQEQFACMAYESLHQVLVDKTGIWLHPTIEWFGASPDRLVGEDGLLEVKCPNTTTHLGYIFDGKVPTDYMKQIQTQLLITERRWCDFISFDPRLPKRNQLLVIRVERDEKMMADIEREVIKFLNEVDALIHELGD